MKKLFATSLVALTLSAPAFADDASKAGNAFDNAGKSIASGFTNGYHATAKAATKGWHKTEKYAHNSGTKTKEFFTTPPKSDEVKKAKINSNSSN